MRGIRERWRSEDIETKKEGEGEGERDIEKDRGRVIQKNKQCI